MTMWIEPEAYRYANFLDEAFGYVGLDWRTYVRIDERYYGRMKSITLGLTRPKPASSWLAAAYRVS